MEELKNKHEEEREKIEKEIAIINTQFKDKENEWHFKEEQLKKEKEKEDAKNQKEIEGTQIYNTQNPIKTVTTRTYVLTCIYIYVYVCTCIYIYTHEHTQR